jgi:hypothetical protein
MTARVNRKRWYSSVILVDSKQEEMVTLYYENELSTA